MSNVTLVTRREGNLALSEILTASRYGVRAWISERQGGVSISPYDSLNLASHVGDNPASVEENRARLATALQLPPERLRFVNQVHGNTVAVAHDVTDHSDADALVGDDDFAVAVLVADCVPILLINRHSHAFAVVHAGWRGLVAGVIASAAKALGPGPSLYAFVGPSISVASYQVGPEVASHFVQVPRAIVADVGDRSRLDLRVVSAYQLHELGLDESNVEFSDAFTDGGARYFSDRAERPCGRFALVAKRAS